MTYAAFDDDGHPWITLPDWHGWHYDPARLVLAHELTSWYEVDVERMPTAAAVLDWFCQCADKNWYTDADLGGLVRAVNALLRPQSWLCSFAAGDRGGSARIRAALRRTGYPPLD